MYISESAGPLDDFTVTIAVDRHFHGFTDVKRTWHEAKDKCFEEGAWLATVESDAILQEILETLKAQNSVLEPGQFWIGLHTGKWTWVSGKFSCYDFSISFMFIY